MKKCVSRWEVSDFKNKWCDENQIIIELISNRLQEYFIEPILDVGAGLGDIAYHSLYDKEVIGIDVNKVSDKDHPLPDKHKRLQVDFFQYVPDVKINTILISHTLQFIDEDLNLLQNKIDTIAPDSIVLVLNKNDDFMGELILWSNQNHTNPNPEVNIPNFPNGYSSVKTEEFKATLSCKTFEDLATQISYLMLIKLNEKLWGMLIEFLKSRLRIPSFTINQHIKIYRKNGNK